MSTTTAESIKGYINDNSSLAFSLSAGNGFSSDMEYITFPTPVNSKRTDNKNGRCIRTEATYEDGSTLVYTYNTNTETFKLVAS